MVSRRAASWLSVRFLPQPISCFITYGFAASCLLIGCPLFASTNRCLSFSHFSWSHSRRRHGLLVSDWLVAFCLDQLQSYSPISWSHSKRRHDWPAPGWSASSPHRPAAALAPAPWPDAARAPSWSRWTRARAPSLGSSSPRRTESRRHPSRPSSGTSSSWRESHIRRRRRSCHVRATPDCCATASSSWPRCVCEG